MSTVLLRLSGLKFKVPMYILPITNADTCILESYYLEEASYLDICDHFNIEKSSFYVKKKRALDHLTTLLYGVL